MHLIYSVLVVVWLTCLGAIAPIHAQTPTPTPTIVPRGMVVGFSAGDATTPIWTPVGGAGVIWSAALSEWVAAVRPTPGSAQYLARAVSGSGQSYTLTLGIYIPAGGVPTPGAGDTINETYLGSVLAGANTMGLLTLGSDSKVRAYYGTTGKECTANSLYKYTSCVSDSECPSDVGGNPGEASCSASAFAVSGALAATTSINLALSQLADSAGARPHDATISLAQDFVVKGSQTRWQGVCAGSTGTTTVNNKACGATSDCTTMCTATDGCLTAGTCGSSNIGTPTVVRLGTQQSGGTLVATTAYLRHAVFVFNASDPSVRHSKVVELHPTADSTPIDWVDAGSTPCASQFGCVDDTTSGSALDGDSTTIRGSQPSDTDIFTLTDYTLGSGEFAVSAVAWASLKEQDDNSQNSGKQVGIGLRNASSSEVMGSSHELANFDTSYRTFDGPLTMAMPGGGAWDVNALRGVLRFTGASGGTSYRVRASNFAAEVEIGLPQPTPGINVFPDVNGDGRERLCIVGDSIMNDPTMYETLLGIADEQTDILKCAQGGRKIGDLLTNWENVLEGLTTGGFACSVQRGEAGPCDVVLLHIGANNSAYVDEATDEGKCYQRGCVGGSSPGIACVTSATCTGGGTCTDDSGPQHGDACDNPFGVENRVATSWVTSSYCIRGDTIGTCCSGVGCTTSRCGGVGICTGGSNPKTLCTGTGTQCTGGGTCSGLVPNGTSSLDDLTYGYGNCARGDPASLACPLGVCMHKTTTAYITDALRELLDIAAARTGSDEVQVGLIGSSNPCVDPTAFKQCVGGTNHTITCAADTDCTGGACRTTNTYTVWNNGLDRAQFINRWMKGAAAARGLSYFDLGGYLNRLAGLNPDENLRDCIHLSDLGQTRAGEALALCVREDYSVQENECSFD